MEIWNYDSITGELVSKSIADESPLEPGVFHIPAYATTLAPPEQKEKQAIVFDSGRWTYVEDHRGEVWWTDKGEEIFIRNLGTVPNGLLSVKPEIVTEPIRELTIEEKLSKVGLNIEDLKAALGLN